MMAYKRPLVIQTPLRLQVSNLYAIVANKETWVSI